MPGPHAAHGTGDERAAKLEAILNTAVAAIITIDGSGIIDSVNPATTAMFGYAADELIGRNVKILMPEPYAGQHDGYLASYLRTGERKVIGIGREVIARRKDGSTFPMHLAVSEFEANGQRHFAGVITDLSSRRAAQDALSLSEMRFRAVFNSATVGMIQLDRTGKYLRVNQRCQDMLGYPEQELLAITPFDITHPDERERDRAEIARLIAGETSNYNVEKRYIRKNGEVIWADVAASRIDDPADARVATLAVVVDITDRKRAETALRDCERRLVQAQKMESVGQLAGGIAHDFNNLLTVIVGNLELMEPRLSDGALRTLLRRVQDAAASGSDLTHRLLGFSRQLPLEPQTVNLNALVTRTSELLRRSIGEHIALSATLAPDVWEVSADPTQIETALTNLAINARDAMPNGGRLVIETRNVNVEKDQVAAERDLSPGDYVVVSVSDTGTGIPPEIRDRVFEPFFTTKPKERGTGLGLAMIYGFAKQSGGHVPLYSEVGHGTTISLYLPRASGPGARIATNTVPTPDALPGDQLVLLVEDDAALRELNSDRLKELGYRVTEAATGARALELIRGGLRPDLVFSDMIMPGGVSGLDLYEQLKSIAPETSFLLTSGYSHEIVSPHGRLSLPVKVLQKPYRMADLAKALREAIASPARR